MNEFMALRVLKWLVVNFNVPFLFKIWSEWYVSSFSCTLLNAPFFMTCNIKKYIGSHFKSSAEKYHLYLLKLVTIHYLFGYF